jgi:hypothetical protein
MGNAPAKLDKVEQKLRKDLNKYDADLAKILRSQKRFLSGVEDLFDTLASIIKLLLSTFDMVVDSSDEFLILIPAGLIFFVASKLTTIF